MDFRFTEEQEMIARTMDSALADICTSAHLRGMINAGHTYDRERWGVLADLGMNGVLVPESVGGLELGEVVMCRLAESCGATLLPEPLTENAGVALPLLADLARIGNDDDLRGQVEKIASGEGYAVVFHPDKPFANGAVTADVIVNVSKEGSIHVGSSSDFVLTFQPAADPLSALYSCEPAASAKQITASAAADAAVSKASLRGSLFCAAELLGLSQAVLDLSVAYANERQQFGRAIGSNQAVKHMLADVQVAISFLRPVLYGAAAMFERNTEFSNAQVSHAWLRATSVADKATRTAIQVHGAMGYSWETDIHLFLKRSLVLGGCWGTRKDHLMRTAKRAACADFL